MLLSLSLLSRFQFITSWRIFLWRVGQTVAGTFAIRKLNLFADFLSHFAGWSRLEAAYSFIPGNIYWSLRLVHLAGCTSSVSAGIRIIWQTATDLAFRIGCFSQRAEPGVEPPVA